MDKIFSFKKGFPLRNHVKHSFPGELCLNLEKPARSGRVCMIEGEEKNEKYQSKSLPDDGNYVQPTFPILSEIQFCLFHG